MSGAWHLTPVAWIRLSRVRTKVCHRTSAPVNTESRIARNTLQNLIESMLVGSSRVWNGAMRSWAAAFVCKTESSYCIACIGLI